MEKNGVFSRVRSRFRSIFSKKSSTVKLRDYNGGLLEIERIMSNQDGEVAGTIIAEATVEFNELPNGAGIALTQETSCFDHGDFGAKQLSLTALSKTPMVISTKSKRFRRLSSGDLNLVRRMTEEIHFDLTNVIYDGNEITSETSIDGSEQTVFKPGPTNPTDQQMLFLKQCLKNIETRPPNINYIAQRWTTNNFEGLFKYMMKGADCVTPTFLRIELADCIPSLKYIRDFLSQYSNFKNLNLEYEYVYATVHSKNISREQKLRGDIKPFLEIENKCRKARISYLTHFVLTSQTTPNITVILRFYCLKPCTKKISPMRNGIIIQLEQLTGHIHNPAHNESNIKLDMIDCSCEENIEPSDDLIDLSENYEDEDIDQSYMTADQTDFNSTTRLEINEAREYLEMFPLLHDLFDRAGVCDLVDDDTVADESDEEEEEEQVRSEHEEDEGDSSEPYADSESISGSDSSDEIESSSEDSSDENDQEDDKKSPKKVCCF